ncbi:MULTISPECIES: 30S ribosomal protein S11 [Hallerella]|uniref:Small ribosomal subunit protein uS11 n=1 Tax=Hallerella succinigenes TaxID=1896222 RepID=A0A2M9A786_9BACT|nr:MULTISPECIES: 30S ribosomal protein S11 [Hallerella]MBS7392651.1 30S ribosomal protein S11 [Fibrobacter sp.]MCR5029666.1 30S ribosomal protein S11 [Fibrobacter sp.]MDD6091685.1 30S ribosomal protein S11 [Hallerella succinigenes]MDY5028950.1 30S ribosomal protein S11 [Hallerella succinigenes]PJJ41518.1 SSU ribosomal protein S11P [Hallerella succinigenes]
MADEEVKETVPAAAETAAPAEEKVKKGKKRVDVQGIACVNASFNNTIVSITDARGNVVAWGSPGNSGFKGSRKSTPFAAQLAAEAAAHKAYDLGIRKVDVRVKGAGGGRESAVRAIKNAGIEVLTIRDVTGVPHNGCRPKKKRRV